MLLLRAFFMFHSFKYWSFTTKHMNLIKFRFSEKATKIWKNISLVLTLLSKNRCFVKTDGRFFPILWPSHNILTLSKSAPIFAETCHQKDKYRLFSQIFVAPLCASEICKEIMYSQIRNHFANWAFRALFRA